MISFTAALFRTLIVSFQYQLPVYWGSIELSIRGKEPFSHHHPKLSIQINFCFLLAKCQNSPRMWWLELFLFGESSDVSWKWWWRHPLLVIQVFLFACASLAVGRRPKHRCKLKYTSPPNGKNPQHLGKVYRTQGQGDCGELWSHHCFAAQWFCVVSCQADQMISHFWLFTFHMPEGDSSQQVQMSYQAFVLAE